MTAFETVSDVRNVLGVAPVWDPQSARLLWADPRAPSLHRLDPASGAAECWDMPEPARAVVLRQDGTLLLALCRRIVAFDPATDKTEDLFTLPETLLRHRFNRGRCDPKGRFVVGTLQEKAKTVGGDQADGTPEESGGTLYQMDAERRIDELFGDVGIPDGLAWSPDGRTMYFADNWLDTVYAFDYAPATGRIGERRVFLRTDDPRRTSVGLRGRCRGLPVDRRIRRLGASCATPPTGGSTGSSTCRSRTPRDAPSAVQGWTRFS